MLLFRDHIACERVHEVLGASLTSTELTQTVRFLLVQHLSVLVLRLHISFDFGLPLVVSLLLVSLVLSEHLLEVFLLLASLFLLELSFHLHFLLEPVDHINFLAERGLVLGALALFLIAQLSVSTLLLLLYLFTLCSKLLLLTLSKKLHVLFLKSLVHATFLQLGGLSFTLLCHLLVELIADESTSLLFSQDGLLLLFVVKQSVEFLDRGPFVLLSELRVDLGAAISLTRSDTVLVGTTDLLSA